MLGIFKENEANIFNLCIAFYIRVAPSQNGVDIAYLVIEKGGSYSFGHLVIGHVGYLLLRSSEGVCNKLGCFL